MELDDVRPRLLPEERRRRIAAAVTRDGVARLDELAASIGVSVDTVRRDIDGLHAEGLVERTRGGAVAREARAGILPLDARIASQSPGKRAIARAAAELIVDGSSLLVNGGSTTLAFAGALSGRRRLSVVTNSLRVPSALSSAVVAQVHVLGGRVDPEIDATVGSEVFRGDAAIAADVAVVSVGGLSAARGLSMSGPDEAALTAAMIGAAARTVVLCDAAKFGREALVRVGGLTAVDVLVTDEPPPPRLRAALDEAGVEVRVATAAEAGGSA